MSHSVIIYPPGNPEPVEIEGIDPDAVVVIGVDWSKFLGDAGIINGLNESTWHPGPGLLIGDGTSLVTRKGKVVTPSDKRIITGVYDDTIPSALTQAWAYVDPAVITEPIAENTYVKISNHIRAGDIMDEVTVKMLVKHR